MKTSLSGNCGLMIDTPRRALYTGLKRKGVRRLNIRDLIASTGLSQAAFAAALHIPKRTVEDWLAGKRQPPPYMLELIEYRITHDPDMTKKAAK